MRTKRPTLEEALRWEREWARSRVVTSREAAFFLGFSSVEDVRKHRRRGTLKAVGRVGRDLVYARWQVERLAVELRPWLHVRWRRAHVQEFAYREPLGAGARLGKHDLGMRLFPVNDPADALIDPVPTNAYSWASFVGKVSMRVLLQAQRRKGSAPGGTRRRH